MADLFEHIHDYVPLRKIYEDAPVAEVWRARRADDEALPGTSDILSGVRIKIATSDEGKRRLGREAEVMAYLSLQLSQEEQRVIRVSDAMLSGPAPYLVYPETGRGSLAAHVMRHGKVSESNVATILGDVLAAVAFAHDQGICHAAISPASVMLDTGYDALLTDWGCGAGIADGDAAESSASSPADAAELIPYSGDSPGDCDPVGFQYLAALLPKVPTPIITDERADLFAIGQVAVYALLGELPRRDPSAALEKAGVSVAMRRVVGKLADLNPRYQYESAEAALSVVTAVYLNRAMNPAMDTIGSGEHRITSSDEHTAVRTAGAIQEPGARIKRLLPWFTLTVVGLGALAWFLVNAMSDM